VKPGIPIKSVAIIGPGLLGGSLALALAGGSRCAVRVWGRRPEVVAQLRLRCPSAVASTDIETAVAGADLVVLCTPVGIMAGLAERLRPALAPGAVVTDTGSVKGAIVEELEPLLGGGARFVGSHPMAGGDQVGLQHARADLFHDAACIVTPTPRTDAATVEKVSAFWTSLGCRVFHLPPGIHDRAIALVSHLPHITAAALVRAAAGPDAPGALDLVGPGFRDSTRIAMGPVPMWDEILLQNRDAVLAAIRSLRSHLDQVETALSQKTSLAGILADARETRLRLQRATLK
jgi:prephenate dehydrogenase